jgi:hypothetical protein
VATAKSRKFQFQSTTYRVVIDEAVTARLRLDEAVETFFEHVINQVREQATGNNANARLHPSDLVRFSFSHPALNTSINLPFTQVDQLSAERITAVIAKTMQSKEEFCIDNQVEINVIVQPFFAGGRRHQHVQFTNIEGKIAAKRCVVQIQNRDTICMARALVVSKAKVDEDRL